MGQNFLPALPALLWLATAAWGIFFAVTCIYPSELERLEGERRINSWLTYTWRFGLLLLGVVATVWASSLVFNKNGVAAILFSILGMSLLTLTLPGTYASLITGKMTVYHGDVFKREDEPARFFIGIVTSLAISAGIAIICFAATIYLFWVNPAPRAKPPRAARMANGPTAPDVYLAQQCLTRQW